MSIIYIKGCGYTKSVTKPNKGQLKIGLTHVVHQFQVNCPCGQTSKKQYINFNFFIDSVTNKEMTGIIYPTLPKRSHNFISVGRQIRVAETQKDLLLYL